MKLGTKILIITAGVIFLVGAYILLFPYIKGWTLDHNNKKAIDDFYKKAAYAEMNAGNGDRPYNDLYLAMQKYNNELFINSQKDLTDPWSVEQTVFDMSDYGITDEAFGVISIPAMDSVMPLYLGATWDNMNKGAVDLSNTSFAIGGENTNAVIACHRGWYGSRYWRDIEKIKVGDTVTLTNLWGTMEYKVTELRVINPNDINAILIQQGKDMLTLFTCHPYGSGGQYRYVVYCERCK